MKCKEIFDMTLAVLDELSPEVNSDDLRERMPYLMALFCGEMLSDAAPLGISDNADACGVFSRGLIDESEDFPLESKFSTPAAYYIAAMLVADFDSPLFDKLFERYTDLVSRIIDGTGGISEPIVDVYGF